ncbi:hypothetical protein PIROE2DRAFT_10732 [Piromyces sp. E2]|nr:hypothetical protein PIROE2DRAFT_10732 [Piromyces sp. E2]|eukprot:OUM62870.1 hypothetical protein PIROE2DRAFT_10732 [Piromyces sp. E2]
MIDEEDCNENDSAMVIQYLINEKKVEYIKINKIRSFEKYHLQEFPYSYATKITVEKYAIVTSYIRENINKISDTLDSIQEVSEDQINDLKNHHLEPFEIKNLFKFNGYNIFSSLYFYKMNHAWYWTDQIINDRSKKIKISFFPMEKDHSS